MKKIGLPLILIVLALISALFFFKTKSKSIQSETPMPEKTMVAKGTDGKTNEILEEALTPGTKSKEYYESKEYSEKKMGRKFTEEEIKLKPAGTTWYRWIYVVEAHRMSLGQNGDIAFYGIVVSDEGKPLSNVNLQVDVKFNEVSFARALPTGHLSHTKAINFTTDASGRFELENEKGRMIIVHQISKDGYTLAGKKEGWAFRFNPEESVHTPDVNKPIEFVMKKVKSK